MNQTPDQNRDRYSRGESGGQGRGNPSSGGRPAASNMTPEQRAEYLRRMEAQRRSQGGQGRRASARRRRRAKINLGIVIFLVMICVVLAFSFYQIAKNGNNPSSGLNTPLDTGLALESGEPDETEGQPVETELSETDPPETEAAELFTVHTVNSSDINLGDLILVNYRYEYALTDTVSVKGLYGNKTTSYGLSYSNLCLTEKTLNAMNRMADAFVADTGCYELIVNSAYRTMADQQRIYDNSVAKNGEEYAKQYVANPGQSEHHTGMAVDLTFYRASEGITVPVAQHPDGGWLKEHCAEHGFIIRYPDDKAHITGISYEPWHFRFVGKPHAAVIMKTGLCLEEYIGLMKNYTLDTKLLHALADGTTAEVSVFSIPSEGYVIYYVPASSEATTEMSIPKGYEHYIVSGNNEDGFIVTVYVGQ